MYKQQDRAARWRVRSMQSAYGVEYQIGCRESHALRQDQALRDTAPIAEIGDHYSSRSGIVDGAGPLPKMAVMPQSLATL
jgi:hypothetical protein